MKSLISVKKTANSFLVVGNQLVAKSEELSIVKKEDVQTARFLLKECQTTQKELEEKRIEITKPLNNFVSEVNTLFKETVSPLLKAKNSIKTKILSYNEKQEKIRKEEEEKKLAKERARLAKLEAERLERERIEREKREEEDRKLKAEQDRLRKLEQERIEKELKAKMASEEEQKKIREEAEKQRLEKERLEQEKLDIQRRERAIEEEKKRFKEEAKSWAKEKDLEQELARKAKEKKVKGVRKTWNWEITEEDSVPRDFCSPDNKKINEAIKSGVREIKGLRIFEATSVR